MIVSRLQHATDRSARDTSFEVSSRNFQLRPRRVSKSAEINGRSSCHASSICSLWKTWISRTVPRITPENTSSRVYLSLRISRRMRARLILFGLYPRDFRASWQPRQSSEWSRIAISIFQARELSSRLPPFLSLSLYRLSLISTFVFVWVSLTLFLSLFMILRWNKNYILTTAWIIFFCCAVTTSTTLCYYVISSHGKWRMRMCTRVCMCARCQKGVKIDRHLDWPANFGSVRQYLLRIHYIHISYTNNIFLFHSHLTSLCKYWNYPNDSCH